LATYIAAKQGVVGLTKSLAVEWGPQNIRMLGVAPTAIDTPGFAGRTAEATSAELNRIAMLDRTIGAALPLGRLGTPDNIARVVLFRASDFSI
jgi:NAD(P)-dependent dehydrogenase (short-subunit alcohol dehydrogenase family)